MQLAEGVWWVRFWRCIEARRVPCTEQTWEWEKLPAGHPEGRYRLLYRPCHGPALGHLMRRFADALIECRAKREAGADLARARAELIGVCDQLGDYLGIGPYPVSAREGDP